MYINERYAQPGCMLICDLCMVIRNGIVSHQGRSDNKITLKYFQKETPDVAVLVLCYYDK